MNRIRGALDEAIDYLVMVIVTVAPVLFPRTLDQPVTVRERRSNPRNKPTSMPDTSNDENEKGRS